MSFLNFNKIVLKYLPYFIRMSCLNLNIFVLKSRYTATILKQFFSQWTVARKCRTKVVCDLRTNLEFQSQFWEDTNCVRYFTPAISEGYYEFQITVRALYSRKQRWHGSVGRKLCTRDEKETARNYSIWPASLPQRTLNHWLWGLLMSVQLNCTSLKECPKRRI